MCNRERILIAVAGLLLLLGSFASAQELDPWVRGLQRTTPGTVPVLVEGMSARSAAIGLSVELVEQHVIRRLELYGLRSGRPAALLISDFSYLYVNINLGRVAASVGVEFKRRVEFQAHGETITKFGASVWHTGALAHLSEPLRSSDTDYLLGILDEMLLKFFADYLLANPRSTW